MVLTALEFRQRKPSAALVGHMGLPDVIVTDGVLS